MGCDHITEQELFHDTHTDFCSVGDEQQPDPTTR
jgi:hypothetical protein